MTELYKDIIGLTYPSGVILRAGAGPRAEGGNVGSIRRPFPRSAISALCFILPEIHLEFAREFKPACAEDDKLWDCFSYIFSCHPLRRQRTSGRDRAPATITLHEPREIYISPLPFSA